MKNQLMKFRKGQTRRSVQVFELFNPLAELIWYKIERITGDYSSSIQ
jgi:hypothetical protein